MNKKILAIACLAIIVTSFTGCDLGGDKSEKTANNSNTESNTESNVKQDSGSGDGNYFETMTDLMARGKSIKCTYTQEVDEETASGVVYMADENALVEITIKTENSPTGKMYAIINKDYHYSWVDGSSTGYKMTVEAAKMDEKMKNSVSKMTDEINYKCVSWKKDSSKFKAPSNINFQDMSEMMEGLGDIDVMEEAEKAEAQANEMICEICKNVPESEQAECLGDVVCDWSK
jgi:hypothetical protein